MINEILRKCLVWEVPAKKGYPLWWTKFKSTGRMVHLHYFFEGAKVELYAVAAMLEIK